MSIINRTNSIDQLAANAMAMASTDSALAGHDDGLCHDHHWARDAAAARQAFPRVADVSCVGTPSSTVHDDIHYAS
ncbi:MAG: hypothetical protein RQ966_14270 [Acetobacteraceae bacterium]|nr:hypothetical protein [Acetobacteraceae bacterium]